MPDLPFHLKLELDAWLSWLQARLEPDDVSFAGAAMAPRREVRWRIRFRSGREVLLHVPAYLIGGGEEAFEWVTMGMETYDWILILRRGEANEFELNRNGMLLARGGEEGVA